MRIFISYRRQDSAGYTGRLSDALAARYGSGNVFLDFANIPAGIDFRSHIRDALSQSDVVLAVIGPGWVGAASRGGEPRLHDPDDYIRTELRTALSLGKPLVPVLVGGAVFPAQSLLPDDISALAHFVAIPIGHATWAQDVSELTRCLDRFETGSRWMRWLPWKR